MNQPPIERPAKAVKRMISQLAKELSQQLGGRPVAIVVGGAEGTRTIWAKHPRENIRHLVGMLKTASHYAAWQHCLEMGLEFEPPVDHDDPEIGECVRKVNDLIRKASAKMKAKQPAGRLDEPRRPRRRIKTATGVDGPGGRNKNPGGTSTPGRTRLVN